MATIRKRVSFADVAVQVPVVAAEASKEESENEDDDCSSFCEITSSEDESVYTSDEDDAETLQLFLEQAYTGSPTSSGLDPAQRSSLLLLDKDFIDSDSDGLLSEGGCTRACAYVCVCVRACCLLYPAVIKVACLGHVLRISRLQDEHVVLG